MCLYNSRKKLEELLNHRFLSVPASLIEWLSQRRKQYLPRILSITRVGVEYYLWRNWLQVWGTAVVLFHNHRDRLRHKPLLFVELVAGFFLNEIFAIRILILFCKTHLKSKAPTDAWSVRICYSILAKLLTLFDFWWLGFVISRFFVSYLEQTSWARGYC